MEGSLLETLCFRSGASVKFAIYEASDTPQAAHILRENLVVLDTYAKCLLEEKQQLQDPCGIDYTLLLKRGVLLERLSVSEKKVLDYEFSDLGKNVHITLAQTKFSNQESDAQTLQVKTLVRVRTLLVYILVHSCHAVYCRKFQRLDEKTHTSFAGVPSTGQARGILRHYRAIARNVGTAHQFEETSSTGINATSTETPYGTCPSSGTTRAEKHTPGGFAVVTASKFSSSYELVIQIIWLS